MLLSLAIILCLATGFLVACIATRVRNSQPSVLLLKAALAAPLGLGVFSITYFVWLVFSSSGTTLMTADAVITALLFLVALRVNLIGRGPTLQEQPASAVAGTRTSVALSWIFWLALINAALSCVRGMLANPMGTGWDAFAIWNLRARFLFRTNGSGAHWKDGFSTLLPWSHPDYPLLLPGGIAHFWTYLLRNSEWVPAAMGVVCAFSTVALLYASVLLLRGRMQAQIAGLVLMGTPFFLKEAVSQYADVPLGFFFLATICLLALRDRLARSEPAGLAFAGFAAGLAAWTKNEGLLFVCAFLVAYGATTARHNWRIAVRQLGWILIGAAPVLIVLVYFKLAIATPGDLFSAQGLGLKLTDPGRYWLIFRWYLKEFFLFGEWAIIPATILLVVYAKLLGTTAWSDNLRIAAITLGLTLAGYAAIYVITPYNLHWHLRFSLNRLFLQVWPAALFIFFSAVRAPEDPRRNDVSQGFREGTASAVPVPSAQDVGFSL